jgi:hypothetical protein
MRKTPGSAAQGLRAGILSDRPGYGGRGYIPREGDDFDAASIAASAKDAVKWAIPPR